ncbi:MAG: pyrroline-5-carboxylate reductase [Bacteroidales bacterium]|nr:pyrroline-5-carboxylate reductase [Bacteroidales bacterium]
MNNLNITILGGGNLGTSIAKGLLRLKGFKKDNIRITEKRTSRIKYLKENGLNCIGDKNLDGIKGADIVIIAVKPQQAAEVLKEIKSGFNGKKQILLSTVTGVCIADIEKHIGKVPIVRIMPNTAIEILESMTCLVYQNLTKQQEEMVTNLFSQLGIALVIQEDLMGAVTVLGACGIAFALRFLRAATQGGIEIGFGAEMSQLIAAQTVKGAAQLILENKSHPEREIDKVTTPMGITISGLNEMEHQGFSSALIKGLLTSYTKLMNNSKTDKNP